MVSLSKLSAITYLLSPPAKTGFIRRSLSSAGPPVFQVIQVLNSTPFGDRNPLGFKNQPFGSLNLPFGSMETSFDVKLKSCFESALWQ